MSDFFCIALIRIEVSISVFNDQIKWISLCISMLDMGHVKML